MCGLQLGSVLLSDETGVLLVSVPAGWRRSARLTPAASSSPRQEAAESSSTGAGGQDAASCLGKRRQRIHKKVVLRRWGVPQVRQGTGRVW